MRHCSRRAASHGGGACSLGGVGLDARPDAPPDGRLPVAARCTFPLLFRIVAGELVTTDESDRFAYFPVGELPERLSPAVRRRLTEWSTQQHQTLPLTDQGPSAREWLARTQFE